MYPREIKAYIHPESCIQIFTEVLFIIPKGGNPMSINGWMDKQIVSYAHKGILLRHKKEGSTDACCHWDEPQKHYAQWKKPDTKGHMLHYFVWNIRNR